MLQQQPCRLGKDPVVWENRHICICSNPVEAHLLDGECVSVWCARSLQACNQRVQQGLASGLTSIAEGRGLRDEIGRVNGLLLVAKTLDPPVYGYALPAQAK